MKDNKVLADLQVDIEELEAKVAPWWSEWWF